MNSETRPSELLQQIAGKLDQAALNAYPVAQFGLSDKFNLADAYRIQKMSLKRRLGRGEKARGVKLGFTSKAKQVQMGVEDVIWGQLTDQMEIQNGGELDFSSFIHPRVEPEIAFRLREDVHETIGLEDALDIIDGLTVALEIIDSRYENFKFSLEDVVADNCSSSAFVLGEWKAALTPIMDSQLELFIDGERVGKGPATAIMGNPFVSLVDAVRISLEQGYELKAGQVILAGAATAAVYLKPGQQVEAKATHLGKVGFHVSKQLDE